MKKNIKDIIAKSKIISNIYFGDRDVIKIHGSLRVGTNYLQKLLENNFECRILMPSDLGWKHGRIIYYRHFKYIIIAKHPFSWVISFWNWEKLHERTNHKSLSEFLMSDVTHPKLKKEWNALNPIDAWNKSCSMYFDYADKDNIVFVRYEDLIKDFTKTMEYISHNLSLSSKLDQFQDVEVRADNWKKPNYQEQLNTSFYSNKKYLEILDEDSLAFMKENLDRELVKRMGYSLDLVNCRN